MYNRRPNRPTSRVFKTAAKATNKIWKTPDKPAGNNVDLIISRASSIAQIGTLLVAVFGYFYTVVPVFQNQKLQEDNAKLQLKNDSESARLTLLLEKQAEIAANSEGLQKLLDDRTFALDKSSTRLKQAELREIKTAETANATAIKLKEEVTSLDKARWKIVVAEFEQQMLFVSINQHSMYLNGAYSDNNFIAEAKSKWYDALITVRTGLDLAKKKNSLVPASYYLQLEHFLNEKSSQLICEMPDFDTEQEQFAKDMRESTSAATEEAQAEIERQKIKAQKEGKRLLVAAGDLEKVERSIRFGQEYKIKNQYREKLLKYRKSCDELPHTFIKELRQKFNVVE